MQKAVIKVKKRVQEAYMGKLGFGNGTVQESAF